MVIFIYADAHAEHHDYAEFGEPGDHDAHEHDEHDDHQHDEVHQVCSIAFSPVFALNLCLVCGIGLTVWIPSHGYY